MGQFPYPEKIALAVITGGHPFDVPAFNQLFRSIEGVDTYIQNMEDFVADWGEVRKKYHAVLFYNFHQQTPQGDEPWPLGPMKNVLDELGETEQGIFVLHHAIEAFMGWQYWGDLCGLPKRSHGFSPNETVRIDIAKPDHPITRGLASWEMVDELYPTEDAGPDCDVLLTTDHPKSMKTIAWTRKHRNARVFCFQSGHDGVTWAAPNFREVVARGIRWCAGRI
jgi:uncharacterized protein